jgi:hypothetical protein
MKTCFVAWGPLSVMVACSSSSGGGSDGGTSASSSGSSSGATSNSSNSGNSGTSSEGSPGTEAGAEGGMVGTSGSSGGAGSGNGCTLTVNGNIQSCISWGNIPSNEIPRLCHVASSSSIEVYARVASCPTGNEVGTCTITQAAGPGVPAITYAQISYGVNNITCAYSQELCTEYAADGSSTFSGPGSDGGC